MTCTEEKHNSKYVYKVHGRASCNDDESLVGELYGESSCVIVASIDFDGKINYFKCHSINKILHGQLYPDTIMQVIGWEAASALMLECITAGVGEGVLDLNEADNFPILSYCCMRLSLDKTHIKCYLN
jgi:hypothetical protein